VKGIVERRGREKREEKAGEGRVREGRIRKGRKGGKGTPVCIFKFSLE